MSYTGHPDFARLNSVVGPPLVNVVNLALTGAYTSALFPVAEYETLEVWNPTLSAATNYRLTFVWWDSPSGGAQLGGNTQCHTVGGRPFRVSIPVAGPYVQIIMEAFSYATSPIVTFAVYPRVGQKPLAVGAGDGNLVSSASPFVGAGAAATFTCNTVVNQRVTIMCQSDQASILCYVVYNLYDASSRVLAVIQPQGGPNFMSMEVQLPPHLVSVIIINTTAVAASLFCSVMLFQ